MRWRAVATLTRPPGKIDRDYGDGRRPHALDDAIDRVVADPVEVEEWTAVVPATTVESRYCGDCGGPLCGATAVCRYCSRCAPVTNGWASSFLGLPVPRKVHDALSAIGVRLEHTADMLAGLHRRTLAEKLIGSIVADTTRDVTDRILSLGDPDLQKMVARALLPLVVRDADVGSADVTPNRRALDYDTDTDD